MTTLPEARNTSCGGCPWRRNAAPGWLGPFDAETWIALAHSDSPIACHESIVDADDEGEGDWAHPDILQCAGAATYRSNICKSPRDPEVATLPADRIKIFGRRDEFLEHHS